MLDDLPEVPTWWKLLNLESDQFERSKYAGPSLDGKGQFRMKDLGVLREVAPQVYESVAGEVKEYNAALCETKGSIRKYKIGRKVGSIPMLHAGLHPELMYDPKAQAKFWADNPEFKCK